MEIHMFAACACWMGGRGWEGKEVAALAPWRDEKPSKPGEEENTGRAEGGKTSLSDVALQSPDHQYGVSAITGPWPAHVRVAWQRIAQEQGQGAWREDILDLESVSTSCLSSWTMGQGRVSPSPQLSSLLLPVSWRSSPRRHEPGAGCSDGQANPQCVTVVGGPIVRGPAAKEKGPLVVNNSAVHSDQYGGTSHCFEHLFRCEGQLYELIKACTGETMPFCHDSRQEKSKGSRSLGWTSTPSDPPPPAVKPCPPLGAYRPCRHNHRTATIGSQKLTLIYVVPWDGLRLSVHQSVGVFCLDCTWRRPGPKLSTQTN
ncbi:hypothetical protein Q8A73_007428 [Channa argus]|nr:hypothetical protein Q8A73_007428 [Channa argus]